MIDDTGPYGEVLLTDGDFPAHFTRMAHTGDNITQSVALPVEFIFNDVPRHKRVLVRMSFSIPAGGFYPITFVANTGAPSPFYLVSRVLLSLSESWPPNDLIPHTSAEHEDKSFSSAGGACYARRFRGSVLHHCRRDEVPGDGRASSAPRSQYHGPKPAHAAWVCSHRGGWQLCKTFGVPLRGESLRPGH